MLSISGAFAQEIVTRLHNTQMKYTNRGNTNIRMLDTLEVVKYDLSPSGTVIIQQVYNGKTVKEEDLLESLKKIAPQGNVATICSSGSDEQGGEYDQKVFEVGLGNGNQLEMILRLYKIESEGFRTIVNVGNKSNNSFKPLKDVIFFDYSLKEGQYLQRSESPFSIFAQTYVNNRMAKWSTKGEFEKTVDWQIRVTDESRKQKAEEFQKDAVTAYAEFLGIKLGFCYVGASMSLGKYDADREVYMIESRDFGMIPVPVPFNEAEKFKNARWCNDDTNPSEVVYYIHNDKIGLAEATFLRKYRYINTSKEAQEGFTSKKGPKSMLEQENDFMETDRQKEREQEKKLWDSFNR